MGLSASQGRLLLLTARRSDLELRAQSISQKRLAISQRLEEVSTEYENACSNRQMKMSLFLNGSAATDAENVQRTSNLTYATLVSGTLTQFSSAQSGIVAYDGTSNIEYASTSAFRLVDADGAIVVSSIEEIPGTVKTTFTTPAASAVDKDGNDLKIANLYQTGSKDENGKFTESSYYALAKENSDLAKFLAEDKKHKAQVDLNTGLLKVDVGTTSTYYNLNNEGELVELADGQAFEGTDVTLVENKNDIPAVTNIKLDGVDRSEGNDNKITLLDLKSGVEIARYVVDPTLAYGSTDVDGPTDGPNYLQDCLRNGKYLIEKGAVSKDDGKVRWSSISWDAISNISDNYYNEDDDKAKAKYDRLQNQLQAQDKKLELELNNIETQRSAVTTEVESVDKVISDNIEGSFNAFG